MTDRLDIVAIGNAIVDVVAQVPDDFLATNGVEKGIMTIGQDDEKGEYVVETEDISETILDSIFSRFCIGK